jgi:hypothetical protein
VEAEESAEDYGGKFTEGCNGDSQVGGRIPQHGMHSMQFPGVLMPDTSHLRSQSREITIDVVH